MNSSLPFTCKHLPLQVPGSLGYVCPLQSLHLASEPHFTSYYKSFTPPSFLCNVSIDTLILLLSPRPGLPNLLRWVGAHFGAAQRGGAPLTISIIQAGVKDLVALGEGIDLHSFFQGFPAPRRLGSCYGQRRAPQTA